jgi:hypothetical protein
VPLNPLVLLADVDEGDVARGVQELPHLLHIRLDDGVLDVF